MSETERYVPNGTPVTEHERELLTILMEECAEVIQDAAKLLRFGKENRPDSNIANTYKLSTEVGEIMCVVEMAVNVGLLSRASINMSKWHKHERLAHYMQTSAP